jgi:hypothetical protein
MRRLLAALLLIPTLAFGGFTEFYCGSGGSNLNSGSDAGTSVYTSTSGNWSTVTNVFTPTDGSNPATASPGAAAGQYASVYVNGASVGVYIARITTVANATNGAITLSSTIKAGTPPTTASGTITIKVGGCFAGFNAASVFPLTLINFGSSLPVSNTTKVRLNVKNDQTYTMNASVTVGANDGALVVQGYSGSVGDGGRATIDFTTTTGALWTNSASKILYADLIWVSSATSGTGGLFIGGASGQMVYRCVAHGARGAGFAAGNSGYSSFIEDEVYDCNKANSVSIAGFTATSTTNPSSMVRCISHDNASGSNADGYFSQGATTFQNCIADTNAGNGFNISVGGSVIASVVEGCDAYNNSVDGIRMSGTDGFIIENCNLVKNTGWGINVSGVVSWGLINNCGFGTGSQVNGSGTSTVAGSLFETGDVSYASGVTPWVDPANGDFRINLAAANFAGRGAFTQTASSYAGTIAYPDIGAAQSKTGVGGTFNKETSGGYSH